MQGTWTVKIMAAVAGLLALGLLLYVSPAQYLTLDTLQAHRETLITYAEANYVTAVVIFMAVYCLKTALSLPGGALLSLAGGLLFGCLLGTLYIIIAATVGAVLDFLSARYLLSDWFEQKFGHRLGPIQDRFARHSFRHLLTLRLLPAVPFSLVNLLSGVTRVSVRTFTAATAIGIIPGSFIFAYAGDQIGIMNPMSEMGLPQVLAALALLITVGVLSFQLSRFLMQPLAQAANPRVSTLRKSCKGFRVRSTYREAANLYPEAR